jgi:hypothetical protein
MWCALWLTFECQDVDQNGHSWLERETLRMLKGIFAMWQLLCHRLKWFLQKICLSCSRDYVDKANIGSIWIALGIKHRILSDSNLQPRIMWVRHLLHGWLMLRMRRKYEGSCDKTGCEWCNIFEKSWSNSVIYFQEVYWNMTTFKKHSRNCVKLVRSQSISDFSWLWWDSESIGEVANIYWFFLYLPLERSDWRGLWLFFSVCPSVKTDKLTSWPSLSWEGCS